MTGDPYRYFRPEARDLIEALMQGVLEIERGRGSPELFSRLLRYAHTLKGAARVVRQARIADLSHAAEDAVAAIRDDPAAVSADRIRDLLAWIDAMSAALSALPRPAAETPAVSMGARTPAPVPGSGATPDPADEQFETIRVDVRDLDAALRTVADLRVSLAGFSRHTRDLEDASRLAGELHRRQADRSRRAVDRSEPEGVERLATALRELHRAVSVTLERADRHVDEIHERATASRLMPVGSLFPRLERTARDAADATGKQVVFESRGGDVRLDANVLRRLGGALIQLVRNAVTHGVELPAERVAAGKAPAGRVGIEAHRLGDRAMFRCSDDGRGIDVERVRQVALARGLVTPAEAAGLTAPAAMACLLQGGISTTRRVSQLSGRGIGLDVVREATGALHGTIAASTEPQRGTSIELSVPVTVESQEVLHVRAGSAVVSIPRAAVRQIRRVSTADVAESPAGRSILHGGNAVRFAALRSLLEPETRELPGPLSALVLESAAGTAAVGVDRLLGTTRVVIQLMPELLRTTPMITGAFLDNEGNPQLVLSADDVIRVVQSGAGSGGQTAPARRPPLLVIDDSLTTRMLEQGILETAGYEVDTAASGEEALEKARQRRYSVFLVDVEMPGMDGFAFIETARADPDLRSVPSIVLTSRDSADDRARGERLGARAYMVKSAFDERQFLKMIRELIG